MEALERWTGFTLVLASGNAHKIEEIGAMLAAAGVDLECLSMKAFGDPPTIEETASDFEGNAALKARGIARWLAEQAQADPTRTVVMADDSGICVDLFDGRPGVHSARFAGPDASDEQNNQRLVEELGARGATESPAHYRCLFALCRLDGRPVWEPSRVHAGQLHAGAPWKIYSRDGLAFVDARCEGDVRSDPVGEGGFGYDPYFWLSGETRSFAQLNPEEKARRSHRGAALHGLLSTWSQLRESTGVSPLDPLAPFR